ncbi:hypothetical protein ACLILY_22975 [Mycobacterium sp. MS3]|uniref:hypothetical protein n=2 Tax=unclassified Mycobacterium TaxID=2642494 RepID=UPI003989F794
MLGHVSEDQACRQVRMFAIVVDEVDRNCGLDNKFEGDPSREIVAGNVGAHERSEYTVICGRSTKQPGSAHWRRRTTQIQLTNSATVQSANETESRLGDLGETVTRRSHDEPIQLVHPC